EEEASDHDDEFCQERQADSRGVAPGIRQAERRIGKTEGRCEHAEGREQGCASGVEMNQRHTQDSVLSTQPVDECESLDDEFLPDVREADGSGLVLSNKSVRVIVEARAHGWRVDHYLSRLFPN